jgi:ubiquinone/menaquinone biosynthesis C-methylase UbiE
MAEANQWDRNYQEGRHARHAVSMRSHLVRRRFELYRPIFARAPGNQLLEVGCAPGDWLVTFAREFGLRPTGVDFAPAGCAVARERLRDAGIEGEVIEADFLKWEPGARRFDVVFFQGSLEHFPDPAEGLRRAARACRPGAVVCAQLPCLAPWHINGIINRVWDREGLADHYTRDLAAMEAAFRDAGLRDVESRRFGTLQLILNQRPDGSRAFRMARWLVALADRAAGEFLNRTDAHLDLAPLSPHILTWGFAA